MSNKITISDSDKELVLEIDFIDNLTSKNIIEHLPIKSKVNLWGEEIYFDTGIEASCQNATLDVNIGDLAYWPQGQCLCVFFGKTPASSNDKPVPASEVVVIGKVNKGIELLKNVKSGSMIKVE